MRKERGEGWREKGAQGRESRWIKGGRERECKEERVDKEREGGRRGRIEREREGGKGRKSRWRKRDREERENREGGRVSRLSNWNIII